MTAQAFTPEEVEVMRGQYEERLEAERASRDELEWKLRRALVQLGEPQERDATLALKRVLLDFSSLLGMPQPKAPIEPTKRFSPPPASVSQPEKESFDEPTKRSRRMHIGY